MRTTRLTSALAGMLLFAAPALAGGMPGGSLSVMGIQIPTGAGAAAFNGSTAAGAATATGGGWSAAASIAGGKSQGIGTEAGDPFASSFTMNYGASSAAGQNAAATFSAAGFGFGFGRFNNN